MKLEPATWRGTGLGALVGNRHIKGMKHPHPWAPRPVPLQLNSTLHSYLQPAARLAGLPHPSNELVIMMRFARTPDDRSRGLYARILLYPSKAATL